MKRLYFCGSLLAIAALSLLSTGLFAEEDAAKVNKPAKVVSNMLTGTPRGLGYLKPARARNADW